FDKSARRALAAFLAETDQGLGQAIDILSREVASLDKPIDGSGWGPLHLHWDLEKYLIQARRWRAVIDLLEPIELDSLKFPDIINLAMANWGETGTLSEDLCREVVEMDEEAEILDQDAPDAKALMLWRLGNQEQALRVLE